MQPRKTILSWSSGKDSAMALAALRADATVEVVGLLTTLNVEHQRVAMHAVRRDVLAAQARAVGLPLHTVELPSPCTHEDYDRLMSAALAEIVAAGITHAAFGDLYLEDVRSYREAQMARARMTPLFPLWGTDTRQLAERIVAAGIEAYLTCVDPRRLPASFAGRRYDRALLEELPAGVDPCGENGEFHTCVLFGPGFSARVPARPGQLAERDGFAFADLVLANE